jgi:hypothetical protein
MEKGLIFTEDKKDIEVFFLKPQQPKLLIDDSIPSDNKDCYNDDLHLMGELDVNENSAGGGAHGCPVGHKGEVGWKGYDSLYGAILDTIRAFENTQLNIASETAQEVLALSIERKIKDYERKTA